MEKKYYEAYEERYTTIHEKGYSWSSDVSSPIVMEIIRKYFMRSKKRDIHYNN